MFPFGIYLVRAECALHCHARPRSIAWPGVSLHVRYIAVCMHHSWWSTHSFHATCTAGGSVAASRPEGRGHQHAQAASNSGACFAGGHRAQEASGCGRGCHLQPGGEQGRRSQGEEAVVLARRCRRGLALAGEGAERCRYCAAGPSGLERCALGLACSSSQPASQQRVMQDPPARLTAFETTYT